MNPQLEQALKKVSTLDVIMPLISEADIDAILDAAPTYSRWDIVQALCDPANKKIPSPAAINKVLSKASIYKQWNEIEFICNHLLPGDEGLYQLAIEQALTNACTPQDGKIPLDFINYICTQSPIKPHQAHINKALKQVASYGALDIVTNICALRGDNRPSQEGVNQALLAAVSKFNIVQYLVERLPAELTPTQKAINDSLVRAAGLNSYEVVDLLSKKAEKKSVNDALIEAAGRRGLESVRYLCQLVTDNRPERTALSTALIDAAAYRRGKMDVVNYLCQLGPEQAAVTAAFTRALDENDWELVRYLSHYQPEQTAIHKALRKAIANEDIATLHSVCAITTDNKPEKSLIHEALIDAASKGRVAIVNALCGMVTNNKPDEVTINQALVTAAVNEAVDAVLFLCDKIINNELGQEALRASLAATILLRSNTAQNASDIIFTKLHPKTVHHAFLTAFCAGNLVLSAYLYQKSPQQDMFNQGMKLLIEQNNLASLKKMLAEESPFSNEATIKLALEEAYAQNKFNECFVFLCGLPNKDTLVTLLMKAVKDNNLSAVRGICAITAKSKPNAEDLATALNNATQPGIQQCLIKAQKMLVLLENIAQLKSYGEQLQQDEESREHGRRAQALAETFSECVNHFTQASFSHSDADLGAIRQSFERELDAGYIAMGDHRMGWKPILVNIAIAATGVGLLLIAAKYLATGSAFFATTKRQDHVQDIEQVYRQEFKAV